MKTVALAACLVLAEVSSIKVEINGCQARKGDARVPSFLSTSGLSSSLLTLMLAEVAFKWFPSPLHGSRAVNCGRKEFARVQQQQGCFLSTTFWPDPMAGVSHSCLPDCFNTLVRLKELRERRERGIEERDNLVDE